ncbi:MAG: hypothetical protein EXQ86_09230 [Rhodospirillales bacterium]|nr:hypothetical protein [Rhodospirillales bacterium]
MQLATIPEGHGFSSNCGVFRPSRIAIRPESILRLQGYKDLEKVRPAIREAAESVARRAEELIVPEIHYRRVAIGPVAEGVLVLENGVKFSCAAFERHLADARAVVVAIATMGARLDDEVIASMDRMGRFEPLDALFLETCGWLGIEQTTKQFSDFLRALVRPHGERVSCRMAPGYSYRVDGRETPWALEEQRQIFQVFSGIDLPVRLLESCAMLPKMSRTGIFGLAPVS